MNYRMMGKFISRILMVEAVFMLPALLIAVYHGEQNTIFGFLTGMVITVAASLLLYLLCRKARKGFYAREGLVCVGASWISVKKVAGSQKLAHLNKPLKNSLLRQG